VATDSDRASWFPDGADEATIKKRFRELAATLQRFIRNSG